MKKLLSLMEDHAKSMGCYDIPFQMWFTELRGKITQLEQKNKELKDEAKCNLELSNDYYDRYVQLEQKLQQYKQLVDKYDIEVKNGQVIGKKFSMDLGGDNVQECNDNLLIKLKAIGCNNNEQRN